MKKSCESVVQSTHKQILMTSLFQVNVGKSRTARGTFLVLSRMLAFYTKAGTQSVDFSICSRLRQSASQCSFSRVLFSLFPFIKILREYHIKDDLVNDIVAGLTIGVMHIPQGNSLSVLLSIHPFKIAFCTYQRNGLRDARQLATDLRSLRLTLSNFHLFFLRHLEAYIHG